MAFILFYNIFRFTTVSIGKFPFYGNGNFNIYPDADFMSLKYPCKSNNPLIFLTFASLV